uniref:Beta-2-glycoprotein 1 n=1 Tax=Scophthalmus maximus TaxID=52904 RepID=A0A8D3BMA6_SCOMX
MASTLAVLLLCQTVLYTSVTSKKVCGHPPTTDGISESTLKLVYEVGEEVTLTCEQGYLPSTTAPRRISCTATGEWTQSNLACSRESLPLYNATLFKRFRHVFLINCSLTLGPVWILDGRIVHDKPVTGATTMYGQGWTYECNPPKAPSYERGSCMADGSASEPPVCREVSCTIPVGIPNGFITFAVMRIHGYKEKVKYGCNENYILDGEAEIQCQNTGHWSSKPVCRAPCKVGIKRGRILYNAKKLWIADLKPNRVLHGEHVVFYCLNRAERCGYPVASTCHDGTLPLPECFEGEFLPAQ